MRRLGRVLFIMLLLIALISAPVLAKPGSGSNNGGGASSKSTSVSNHQVTQSSPGKSSPAAVNKDKTSVQESKSEKATGKKSSPVSSYRNMSSEQKKELANKFQELQRQTTPKEFKDTSSHWASKNIAKIQSLGLISGYQDGTFQPDAQVSNAEAMTMVVNLVETVNTEDTAAQNETPVENQEPAVTGEVDNSDVPEWAKESAAQAVSLRIININRFHSQVQASRAQVAVMLAKALKLEPVTPDESVFNDGKYISAEDLGYILALKQAGIVNGSPDGKFNPNSAITRAEMATMLANVVEEVEEDINEEVDENVEENVDGDESNTDPAATDDTNANPEPTPTPDTDNTTTPVPTGDNTTSEPVNNDGTASSTATTTTP